MSWFRDVWDGIATTLVGMNITWSHLFRKKVTLHYPESPNGSTALEPKGVLPSAYELDDAPEFERFVLVTSKEPVQVERVLEAARILAGDRARARDAKLPLPGELAQTSLILRKVSP